MAGNATTTAADGSVVAVTHTPPEATISYGRKNGLPNYSNEEMSVFLKVPLDGIDLNDASAVENALVPHTALIKAFVCNQLGVPFEVGTDGVVRGEVPAEAPKAARGGGARKPAAAKAPKATDEEAQELWARLAGAEQFTTKKGDVAWKAQDGEVIFDNREGKRNPKAPDFKFADGEQALWLDSKPAFFSEPGAGVTL